MLLETVSIIRDQLNQQAKETAGLTLAQFGLLRRLADAPQGALRMTDLADALVASRSGTSYQVDQLEKRGLVERRPSASDERSIEAAITQAGRVAIDAIQPGHTALIRRLFFDHVSPSDLDAVTQALDGVRENLRDAPTRSTRRRA
jgi:DNA-binding MarR family transcriptional regulator